MKYTLHKKSLHMKAILKLAMLFLLTGKVGFAQLSGTLTVPGSYATLASAITDLNAQGVGTGGVTLNVAAGFRETAPAGGYRLSATGTVSNPIVIQVDPSTQPGTNPMITAPVGTSTSVDGIFYLLGSDYVTINGIDLQESGANATTTTQMEWGYSLLNKNTSAPFDGCNHVTISNCSITLNRTNTISKGINSSHVTVAGTAITPTSIVDVHSYNRFYGLKIQNCWTAINIIGYDDPNAPYTLKDNFNDVGGSSYATADTLTNLGIGTTSTGTTSCGVYTFNQSNLNVSYNNIDNAANGGLGATNMFIGIYAMGSSSFYLCNGTTTFNNNKITVTHAAGSGVTYCMNINDYDGDLGISNNDIKWLTTGTVTGTQYGIYVNHAQTASTGTFTFKYNTAQNFTFNMSTSTANTFYFNGITQTIQDVGYNTVNNVSRTGGTTGSFYGMYNNFNAAASTPNSTSNFYNNTFTNISNVASSTCSFYGFQFGGNYYTNIYNNRIDSITTTGGGSVTTHAMLIVTGSEVSVYNNTITNITGSGTVDAILLQVNSGLNVQRTYSNTIGNITSNIAASIVYGIYNFYGAAVGNYIYKNKIYNLNNTGSGNNVVHGIYIAQGAGGILYTVPYYIENNMIGALKAANSTITTTPSVMGISFNAIATNPYAAYARYNSIYLNDVGAANSNSAGIYQVTNSSTLVRLNNNLIINNTAHQSGTGMACALFRNGTSFTSYDLTSNNNLLYAGTPSLRNLLFYDGTNKDFDMNTFKSRVSPRESASLTENTTMFNVASTAANYLQNDTTVASLVEGGAVNISGVTTDIRGVIRQGNPGYAGTGSRPDIGAFESEGSGINMVFDSVLVVKNNANALLNYSNQPVVNIQVYVSGNTNAISATQLNLNTNGTTNTADISKAKVFYTGSSNTFIASSQFGASINNPNNTISFTGNQALNNGLNNFWLTYDIPSNANVGNIVDGIVDNVVVGGNSKSPQYPNTAGSKTITAPFNGSFYTVGVPPYTSLAITIAALNSNGVSGPTVINIPAGFTETAPVGGYVLGSAILNASLSSTNTLSFVKSGTGTNPLLTANAGTSATVDGIFTITGCDYVTIDGIDLIDPTSNATATTQMEWGYGLLKFSNATPFDGCQHNIIQNCTVTLQRINTTSKGIYVNNHIATDATLLTITSPSDANSYNSFLLNTIKNVNTGIYMNGYSVSTSQAITSLYDQYNTIGDTLTGNTILNFGGAAAGFGINSLNQANVKIKYNTVDNYDGGRNSAVGATTAIAGIQNTYTNVSSLNLVSPNVSGNSVNLTLASGATVIATCITVQSSHGDVVITNNSIKLATLGTGALTGAGLQGILYNSSQGGGILANSLTFTGNTANSFSFAIGGTGLVNIFSIGGPSYNDEISYNTIYNVNRTASTTLGSGQVTLISNATTSNPASSSLSTLTRNIHDNSIVNYNNSYNNTGALANTSVIIGLSTNSTYNTNVYNNRISSVSGYASSSITGIIISGGTVINANINGNTIDTLTSNAAVIAGISYTEPAAFSTSIYDNVVSNITTAGTGAMHASGIFIPSGGRNLNVYRNKTYNIRTNSTGAAYAVGIYYNGIGNGAYNLTPTSFRHNLISGIFAPTSTLSTSPPVSGFMFGLSSPTGWPSLQVAHNTVYLTGNTGNNLNSYAICFGTISSFTVATMNPAIKLNNNIAINLITPSGTGSAVALSLSATSTVSFDNSSNNNVFYAGTPSSTHPVFYDGTNRDQTISAYKARVYPRENASMTENVSFLSVNGTSASYLMVDPSVATSIADAGTPIAGITTDFLGSTLSSTTPDIGSYEGSYISNDVTAPAISMTALPNSGIVYSPINFTATIKDLTGVDNNTQPLVYYKKSTSPTYTYSSGTLVSGNINNGTWSFAIDPNMLGGLNLGDIINYFVIAQDISSNVNTGSGPFGVVANGVYSITTNPTPYSFTIVGALSGNYTVCASGCSFNSLTNTYGAFDTINKSAITGDVTLSIAGDLLTETGLVMLNQIAQSANYGVSILPDGPTERLIVGTVAAAPYGVITLSGADRVTIDGRYAGSGKYLRIRNRSTAGCTIRFTNDSHLDTVRYAYIEGNTQAVGTVWFNAPGANGTGNDSNAVMYCDISDTLGNGINTSLSIQAVQNSSFYSDGHNNSENTIAYNNIYNFIYQGVNIASGLGGNENWVIDHNSFYQGPTAAAKAGSVQSVSTQAIQLSSGQGHRITNNSIGGSAPDRSGAPFKGGYLSTGAMSFYGIQLANSAMGLDRLTTISGNTISNIDANPFGGSNQFGGIVVSGGYVSVTGNTIGGGAMPYDTIKEGSYSTTNCGGIVLAGGDVTVSGNNIGNISNYVPNSTLTGVRTIGINIAGSGAVVNKYAISNNIIHDIRSNYNYSTTSNLFSFQGTSPVGILNATGAGVLATIEDNTIYNIINTQVGVMGTANMAYGIAIRGGVNTIQRNKIYNVYGLGNGSGNNSNFAYGVFISSATTSPLGQIVRNNQISLSSNASDDSQIFGIMDASTAICNNSIFNNSVFIGGTASGSNKTYGLSMANANSYTTTNTFNNILYNSRTGGAGSHFAAGSYFTTTGITASTLNYNLLIAPITSALLEMPAGTSMGITEINNMFTSKGNTNWMTTPSTVASSALFANTAIGDLSINTNNAASWYANGKGIALASVTNDYNKSNRSTSILTGATDIGAVEFTTSTTPSSATANAAPAANATTTYTFAGRQVASITWGSAGTLPTSVDVKYYSGSPAPSLHAVMKTYNGYYVVTPTGGTGYNYNVSFNYDSSMFGNVPSTSLARMARYSSSSWSNVSTSSANASNSMMLSNTSLASTTLPGIFTISDTATIPLSNVNLTVTAFLQGLYLGGNTMIAAPFAADGVSPINLADSITIELHDAATQALSFSRPALLGTNGLTTVTLPASVNGNSYYIAISHRNSITTWSTAPVLMNSSGTSYNFSTAANKAAGDNMMNDGSGVYLIYTGDINQDGSVDFNDYPLLDIASSAGLLGYDVNDLNGDASVDFNDYPMIDINSSNGIISITP